MKSLAALFLIILISGCTATGHMTRTEPPEHPHTTDIRENTTQRNTTEINTPQKTTQKTVLSGVPTQTNTNQNKTPENTTQNKTIPPDPCDSVPCEDSERKCPDGYVSFCSNFCYGEGICSQCTPDCSGHGKKTSQAPSDSNPSPPEPEVEITKIQADAPGDDRRKENWNGEWVEISNPGSAPANLTGWALSDASEHIFVFPKFILGEGTSVKVHSGDGEANQTDLFWNSGRRPIWNNKGDTATLKNEHSETISEYTY